MDYVKDDIVCFVGVFGWIVVDYSVGFLVVGQFWMNQVLLDVVYFCDYMQILDLCEVILYICYCYVDGGGQCIIGVDVIILVSQVVLYLVVMCVVLMLVFDG